MNKTPSKTLSRVTAAVLTVAFLGFIFTAFFTMVITHHQELRHSVQMTNEMKKTLPEHADRLDRLSARINGFTSAIATNMWLKEDMGYANSAFQYALGKKVINTGSQRIAGCQQALREAGLDVAADSLAEYGPLSSEGGWRGMDSALKKGRRFTAVFAFSDEAAAGAISRLNAAGLRVPEDVQLIGYDGVRCFNSEGELFCSTIVQPVEDIARQSMAVLTDMMENHAPARHITLEGKLEIRESVRDSSKF